MVLNCQVCLARPSLSGLIPAHGAANGGDNVICHCVYSSTSLRHIKPHHAPLLWPLGLVTYYCVYLGLICISGKLIQIC